MQRIKDIEQSLTEARAGRRRWLRFPVDAGVLFIWNVRGEMKRGAGRTRDMSRSGAYVICEAQCEFEAGQQIALEGLLPAVNGAQAISFHAQGMVVRRGTQQEEEGFAVVAELEIAERRSIA